jgi:FkbM family methyltransferase
MSTNPAGNDPYTGDPTRLRLVDVGGAGGLQQKWLPHLEKIDPILFEANPGEAARLRAAFPGSQVIEAGLSNVSETRDLIITKNHFCISLLNPNQTLLDNYVIKPHFEVVGRRSVYCTRFDTLFAQGIVRAPDVIKIDVQGFEYEVLLGFGGLLSSCIGIELEAHLYPLYENQKLLHDLIGLLQDFGLVLRKIAPVPHFDGDIVEVDAYFTRPRPSIQKLPDNERWKFDLLTGVWGLQHYHF